MITVYLNRQVTDDERRESLFAGDFYLYSGKPGPLGLVDHAKDLISEAFAGLDPERAQFELSVEEFVDRVGPLKAEFTNGERTKELCRQFALDLDMDPERTYFDIPRLRVSPPTTS